MIYKTPYNLHANKGSYACICTLNSKLFFFNLFFRNKVPQRKTFTERPTILMSTGNVGNDNFQKLNSSTFQNETENYNDKRLSINATSESNVASVQLSIIILICLGVIILGFYVASYKIKKISF